MEKSYTASAVRKRKWRQENHELYLKSNRERNWRLNGIDVDSANAKRNSVKSCEICKLPYEELHVDHCHQTGKLRGMLCTRCNSGLGFFQDNTRFLEEAIFYLDRNGEY